MASVVESNCRVPFKHAVECIHLFTSDVAGGNRGTSPPPETRKICKGWDSPRLSQQLESISADNLNFR